MNHHDCPPLIPSNPLMHSQFVTPEHTNVLLGRGKRCCANVGNQQLRTIVQSVKSDHRQLPDGGRSKTNLCEQLVRGFQGRFLKKTQQGTEHGWVQMSTKEAVKKVQADIRSSLCADRKDTQQTPLTPVSPPSTSTSLVAGDTGSQKNAKLFVPFLTGALGVSELEAHSMMTNPKNQDSFKKMLTTISNAMESFV